MDGTVFFGRGGSHVFLHHGAQELANILPDAQRRTLEGQDHSSLSLVVLFHPGLSTQLHWIPGTHEVFLKVHLPEH